VINIKPVVPITPATDGFNLVLSNPNKKKTNRGVRIIKSANE
jgi:hypothetical protein